MGNWLCLQRHGVNMAPLRRARLHAAQFLASRRVSSRAWSRSMAEEILLGYVEAAYRLTAVYVQTTNGGDMHGILCTMHADWRIVHTLSCLRVRQA